MSLDEKRTQAASALRMISNTGDEYGKVGRLNEAGTDYDWDVPGKPGFVYCRIEREGTTEPGICIPFVALEPEVRIAFWNVNGVLIAVRPDFLDAVNLLGVLAPSLMVPMLPASGRGGIGNLTPATNSVIAGDGQGWASTPLLTLLTAIGFLSGHEILVDDVAQTQRAGLNFLPADWLLPVGADDSGNDETEFAYTLDPTGVTDIGTPASDDKLPIWDESANVIKYVEASQLGGGGGGGGGSITRQTSHVLYDNTLGADGAWDIQESALVTGAGAFADYDLIELRVTPVRSNAAVSIDLLYLLFGTGGSALDTTVGNYRYVLAGSGSGADNFPYFAQVPGASAASTYMGSIRAFILNPADTVHDKQTQALVSSRVSATGMGAEVWTHNWENTGAIDRIGIRTDNHATDQLLAGSRLQIIGYKEEAIGSGGTTPDFNEDDTDDLNFTNTTPTASANPASIVFTAPASGMVIITVTALVASEVATHLAVLSYEVREGNVVGSGTVVKAAHENYGLVAGRAVVTGGADLGSGSSRTLVSGLTPSDEYNVQTLRWVSSGDGQGDVYYQALMVEYV